MLNTEERQGVIYFVGEEVEHTICHGMRTLFVVGCPPLEEILNKAKIHMCKHVYFGTSQSFEPKNLHEAVEWEDTITQVLEEGYWVTLDFDVSKSDLVTDGAYNGYEKFVPMISVKIPHIKVFNYNATVKIDDKTWGATNPGVWTHHLTSLLDTRKFTHWDQYTNDTNVDD